MTTTDELDSILGENEMVVVNLWAGDSEPVVGFKATFGNVAKNHDTVKFCDVNLDAEPEIAEAFKVDCVPQTLVFKQRHLLLQQTGDFPAEMLEQIVSTLKTIDIEKVKAAVSASQEANV